MRCLRVLLPSAALSFFAVQLFAQAVISARSGIVHFSEGAVFLDDQPLDQKVATFPSIKEGSTLRTERGRAEVLLTPGVFLRLDENSAIRMRSTALTDTRVDFLQGSVIVDSLDALADNHVVVNYKDSQIRFAKQGIYRLDFDTATVQAYSGEAQITHDGKSANVDDAHLFFLTLDLTTRKLDTGTEDAFYDWARERSNAISAENQLAGQSSGNPGDGDFDADADPNGALGGTSGGMLGGIPNYGVPNGGMGGLGVPNYPVPDYSSSVLFNPFGYAAGAPYYPYPAFPLILIARPYRYHSGYSRWPHTSPSGSATRWTDVPHSPITGPIYTGVEPIHPMRPTMSRPAYARPGYARPGYARPGYARPVAPRPMSAPAAVHPIGHR